MKTNKLYILLLFCGLIIAFISLSWAQQKVYKEITPQELRAKLEDVGAKRALPFLLIDARSPGRYLAGHIKGARHIPWKEMKITDLPTDKGAMIVFYCDGPG